MRKYPTFIFILLLMLLLPPNFDLNQTFAKPNSNEDIVFISKKSVPKQSSVKYAGMNTKELGTFNSKENTISKNQNSESPQKDKKFSSLPSGIDIEAFLPNSFDNEVDNSTYYGDGLIFAGTATDAANKPFPGVEVNLFSNKSVADITFDNTTIADQTTFADLNGDYSFSISYTATDIGDYNYTVWYADQDNGDPELGISCYNCNKTVGFQNVRVKDQLLVTYVFAPNRPTIGPVETYTITVTVADSQLNVLTASQIAPLTVRVDRNFGIATDDSTTLGLDLSGQAIFSDSYPGSGDDSVVFTITLLGWDSLPLKFFTIDDIVEVQSFSKTISSDYTFGLLGDVGGTTVPGDDTVRFFRTNQIVTIQGDLDNQTIVNPTEYQGINYEIRISGGGYTGADLLGTTNSTGDFLRTIILDNVTFPDPSTPITFQGFVDNPNVNTVNLLLYMQATPTSIVTTIDTTAINPNGFVSGIHWANNGSVYRISGTVFDEAGNASINVPVVLHFTDQMRRGAVGPITDAPVFSQTKQTDGLGNFFFDFQIPNLPFQQQNITANVTISNINPVWDDSTGLTDSVATFSYLNQLDLDISNIVLKVNNGSLVDFNDDNFFLFNDTFADYQNIGLNYFFNVTIRDIYNRIPYGLKLTYIYDENNATSNIEIGSRQSTEYFINKTNNGKFQFFVHSTSSYDVTNLLKNWGSKFVYEFYIARGQGSFPISSSRFGQTITLIGPDNDKIDASQVESGFSMNGNNQNKRSDINIVFNMDNSSSAIDNIRNITIAYKVTPTGGINDSSFNISVFDSVSWTYELMFYNGIDFIFTFPYANYGDGYWFMLKIMIYDLEGHGIDENGNTYGGNTWSNQVSPGLFYPTTTPAQAQYSSGIYSNATLINSTSGLPFIGKMGDTFIQPINLSESLLINANSIVDGYNITTINDDIIFIISLPIDTTGYSTVFLLYRFLFDESGSLIGLNALNTTVPYINVSMTLLSNETTVVRFIYVIPSSQLRFGSLLDFKIIAKDTSGNEVESDPFVDNQGNIINNLQATKILDLDAPISTDNNFNDLPVPGRQRDDIESVTIWSNETNLNYGLNYTIVDINGTGIDSIIIYWYLDNVLTQNETLVENGLILNNNTIAIPNGFVILFYIPLGLFQENSTISWTINVTDFSGNVGILNIQSVRPLNFDIEKPPADSSIGTTVPEPVTPLEEEVNNALWIITGFFLIMGLLALYYQRHNIREIWDRRQRRKKVEGTLAELMDEIKRLGAENKYKRAILLTWEALERVSREILQAPRKYNQTASEYANYLSTITIVDRDTLLTISSAFEGARYGKDSPTQDDWDDSVKALEIIVRTIIESGARSRITDDDEDW